MRKVRLDKQKIDEYCNVNNEKMKTGEINVTLEFSQMLIYMKNLNCDMEYEVLRENENICILRNVRYNIPKDLLLVEPVVENS